MSHHRPDRPVACRRVLGARGGAQYNSRMRRVLLPLVLLSACPRGDDSPVATAGSSSAAETGPASTGATASAPSSSGVPTTGAGTTGAPEVLGLDLMERLAGLWSGPGTMTPLGDFALMNMDLRAASGRVLFGRVDLDADNSLRFAFEVEDHGEGPVLVYRNGGYFLGILRDSRATLTSRDGDTWRFCSATQGCDYIDARFMFAAEDRFILDVDVKGQQHLLWDATRAETRALPEPFPVDLTPEAPDAPFPAMPTLRVDVTWAPALTQDGEVWVIVTTQPCDAQLQCKHSRSLRAAAASGATAASLVLDQIHSGDYLLTAVLDRNGNMAETLFPDAGDGVSLPNQPIEVAPAGESTAKAAIVVTL